MAANRRREENVRRKELEGERERNRERKLRAQGGREWDQDKGDVVAGRDKRDVEGYRWQEGKEEDLSMYEWKEDRGRGRGRGRGGRVVEGGEEGEEAMPTVRSRDSQMSRLRRSFPHCP